MLRYNLICRCLLRAHNNSTCKQKKQRVIAFSNSSRYNVQLSYDWGQYKRAKARPKLYFDDQTYAVDVLLSYAPSEPFTALLAQPIT